MKKDKIRCPACPRSMPRDEYEDHWARFHAACFYTGRKQPMPPPREIREKQRPERISDEPSPLWED